MRISQKKERERYKCSSRCVLFYYAIFQPFAEECLYEAKYIPQKP